MILVEGLFSVCFLPTRKNPPCGFTVQQCKEQWKIQQEEIRSNTCLSKTTTQFIVESDANSLFVYSFHENSFKEIHYQQRYSAMFILTKYSAVFRWNLIIIIIITKSWYDYLATSCFGQ